MAANLTFEELAALSEAEADDLRAEHTRFFDKVANKENWKLAINAVIPIEDVEDTKAAIAFFTGSDTMVYRWSDTHKLIRAEGYYATIGA